MRVLHIAKQRGWTGQTNRTLNVVRGLNARGVWTGVVAHSGSELHRRAENAGAPVFALPLYGLGLYASMLRLARLLRRERIDILHAHGPRDHLAAAFCRRIGAAPRLVRTRHGHQAIRSGWFSRTLYGACDAVIHVSESVRTSGGVEGVSGGLERVVRTAVDVARFSPGEASEELRDSLCIAPGAFVIGHVSTLGSRKGVDVLLRAVARLKGDSVGPPVRCVVAGPGAASWAPLVSELGVADAVVFTGPQRDIPALLRTFDVFAMPSRREALGTAAIEAMAAGVPLVGSDVDGLIEVITPDTGLLAPVGDDAALADALRQLRDDPNKRDSMARAARRRALAEFSCDQMVEQILHVYCEIAPERGAAIGAGPTPRAEPAAASAQPGGNDQRDVMATEKIEL